MPGAKSAIKLLAGAKPQQQQLPSPPPVQVARGGLPTSITDMKWRCNPCTNYAATTRVKAHRSSVRVA